MVGGKECPALRLIVFLAFLLAPSSAAKASFPTQTIINLLETWQTTKDTVLVNLSAGRSDTCDYIRPFWLRAALLKLRERERGKLLLYEFRVMG